MQWGYSAKHETCSYKLTSCVPGVSMRKPSTLLTVLEFPKEGWGVGASEAGGLRDQDLDLEQCSLQGVSSMEQAPRKRGRPKLFLTKEMIEERKLLKRICRNTRRNLQGDAPLGDAAIGTLDENGENAAPDANSTGEAPPGEAVAASLDENEGNAASDENLASSTGQQANSIGSRRLRQNIDMKKKRFFENNLILDLGNQDKTCAWTPGDCVSLALSGALFSWSKPLLVISGVHKGSSCGHNLFHSGAVASAREALSSGVPSMSISLNWKRDDSQESDLKDAVSVCLPLITAAISDIQKGDFPKCCLLNVDVPTSPLKNKGFKSTIKSLWRSVPTWLAVSASRQPSAARFMSNQQSLGMQLAQLSRDASAAGAARRSTSQQKNMEVDSVGVSKKSNSNRTVKYFIQELVDKDLEDANEELDFRALENGYVAITPIFISPSTDADIQAAVSSWISSAIQEPQ
ncbi:hypothetical protein POM88_043703 [Heracleum sosnowskyi]|uniref:Survival protein SurE-like phosphatase/nucleotidase domain-containing protein n=1 Tax=Heracleum sosnowskyi TaxID=360622 RepID=A0AAD8H2K1_9APIA|nr:hypothetical protein POM88_043703 [Heracleum sosnowskyi]